MGRIFAVTSGKGGVGKSTFSIGLAVAFSRMKKEVLLVDMDEGLRCLDLMLDVDKTVVFDLCDALSDSPEKAIYKVDKFERVSLIPASAKVGGVDSEKLSVFIPEIAKKYDVVIFDFSAGINPDFYKAFPENTQFLTVATPEAVSVRDAAAVANALAELGYNSSLVINRFNIKKMRKGFYHNIDEMIDLSGLRLSGIVPESEELSLFSIKRKLKKRGKPALAFGRIAQRLYGNRVFLPKFKKI